MKAARHRSHSRQSEAKTEADDRCEDAPTERNAARNVRTVLKAPASPQRTNSRRSKCEQADRQDRPPLGLWPRESLQLMHACEFGMEAILNWANDKENSSKNEQARSSIDHTFGTDRLMSGEEDGLRDDFLDDVRSVRHIAAVSRRQIRHACARQPLVRAIAWRRWRIANPCQ